MASQVNEGSVEAKTIRKHYSDLTQAVQDPLRLAVKLYSEDVISRGVLDSTRESSGTTFEKSMYLLQVVSDQITAEPKIFHDFIAILRNLDSSLQAVAELVISTYYVHLKQNKGGFTGDQGEESEKGIHLPKRLKLSCGAEGGQCTFVKKECQEIRLSWKQCRPLPITMSGGTAVVSGSKVYVYTYGGSMYEYEMLENSWCNEISCPVRDSSLAVIDGLLTLLGGSAKRTLLCLVENPKDGTKRWSELYKPMQEQRYRPAVTSNSKHFIVAGGECSLKRIVEVMTIDTQEWQGSISVPYNDGDIGSATIIGDNLYLMFVHENITSCCSIVTSSLTKLLEKSTSTAAQSVVKPLLWQKLQEGPPLYKPCTVQLCGNLLAIGGYVTKDYDYREMKDVYKCNGSAYVYDEQKEKWSSVCRLPSKLGFPDHQFVVASLSDERIMVIGGTKFTNDGDESAPSSDIVHVGTTL